MVLTWRRPASPWRDTYPLALLARVFVGMGDAMTFICVLRLVERPGSRCAGSRCVMQLTGVLGQLGAIGAAIPMTWALGHLGLDAGLPPRRLARDRAGHRRCCWSSCTTSPSAAHLPRRGAEPGRRSAQPRRVVAPPGHPAGLLDALHHPVQRHRLLAAVGLPVLRAGRAPHRPGSAGVLLTVMVLAVMAAGPALGWLDRPAPLAPLHPGARRSSARSWPSGPPCSPGPATRRCCCSWCSSW